MFSFFSPNNSFFLRNDRREEVFINGSKSGYHSAGAASSSSVIFIPFFSFVMPRFTVISPFFYIYICLFLVVSHRSCRRRTHSVFINFSKCHKQGWEMSVCHSKLSILGLSGWLSIFSILARKTQPIVVYISSAHRPTSSPNSSSPLWPVVEKEEKKT